MTLPEKDAPTTSATALSATAFGRRAVFAGAGVAAVGAVAACSGGTTTDDDGGQQEAGDAPEGSPGTVLGAASEVPEGGGKIYSDEQIVVTQPAAGRFTGLSTVCPHAGCAVNAVADGTIQCPCHGSRFALDGAVVQGPAQEPLGQRPVTVADGSITLG